MKLNTYTDITQKLKTGSPTMTVHTMVTWDGTELFYRAWQSEHPTAKAVILFHGGHEHSGRFQDLVNRLELGDVSLFAWDARGHGRSPGKRGYARHFHDFVRDADVFVQHISVTWDIPIENMVLLGHSVGSVIISAWLHDYARQVRGAIVSSPAFQVKLYMPFALPLLRVLQYIRPDSFVNSYVRPSFLTHDREEVDSRCNDPLISPRISVRVLTSLFDTAKRVIDGADSITVPVLCFSAGSDWVVHRKAHEAFFNRLGSKFKALQIYPGFFHEILHEQDRHLPIMQAKQFIEMVFAKDPESLSALPVAYRSNEQYARLCQPLAWINPKKYIYGTMKIALRTLGCLSEGIRRAMKTGFDAGQSLDYIYENRARGWTFVGRAIDRLYLDSPGWRLIRLREQHLQLSLLSLIGHITENGRSVHIVDLACGQGHYVLKVLENICNPRVSAVCRDIEATELCKGIRAAKRSGIVNISFEKGDAFNTKSLADIKPKPDIIIVSGLYELYDDNRMLQKSLVGIYQALKEGGYLIFTNQPHHPQLELIARTLVNRHIKPWVMRLRSQTEMSLLVRQVGFGICQVLIDDEGVFSVSIAQKSTGSSSSFADVSLSRDASLV